MSELTFWALLSLLDWSKSGDDDAVVAPVVAELSTLTVSEITAFEDRLALTLFALDTKMHAKEIGEGSYSEGNHFSVDWFLYARCAVVANGKELYDRVLAHPSAFPKNMEFEALLGISAAAHYAKTGEDFMYSSKTSYETYSNTAGWK